MVALVVDWLRSELDDPEITSQDNFLDVGAHSLTFMRLNRFLSESQGLELDMRRTYDQSLQEAVGAATPTVTS